MSIFYLNDECVHCLEQLRAINAKAEDWTTENTGVLGLSSVTPERNKESGKLDQLAIQLLSDRNHDNARRYASYDEFEELELNATVLIDRQGRVHWKRTGGKPFADVDFLFAPVALEAQFARVNAHPRLRQDQRTADDHLVGIEFLGKSTRFISQYGNDSPVTSQSARATIPVPHRCNQRSGGDDYRNPRRQNALALLWD